MAVWPDWRSTVAFSEDGPGVTLLHESPELKVVLVGLGVGQALPVHPGPWRRSTSRMVRASWLSAQRRSRWRRGRRWWFRRASRGGSGRRPGWCSSGALAIRLRRTDRTDERRVRGRRAPHPWGVYVWLRTTRSAYGCTPTRPTPPVAQPQE